jgi:hypothetical protein
MPSFSDSSSAILSSPHVGFSRAIRRTSSRTSLGSAGRPGLRDFHRQNILKALRCHLTNVSGFTITSASRQSKNLASATIARRIEAVVRRGLAFLEHGQLFSKEKILGHQGSARGKEQPDERQQLRILQELAFLPAVRAEFLRSTASRVEIGNVHTSLRESSRTLRAKVRFWTLNTCRMEAWWGRGVWGRFSESEQD